MYRVIFWFATVFGGILQIVASIYGKNKMFRLLPMGIWLVITAGTLVFGSLFGTIGIFGALVLAWHEVKVLLVMAVAWGLVELVRWTKR